MQLDIDAAIKVYPTIERSARAAISGRVFGAPKDVAAYAFGACIVSGGVISDAGAFSTDNSEGIDAETSRTRFLDALLPGDAPDAGHINGLIRALDTDIKVELTKPQRHEAVVRAVYALGLALGSEGQVFGA